MEASRMCDAVMRGGGRQEAAVPGNKQAASAVQTVLLIYTYIITLALLTLHTYNEIRQRTIQNSDSTRIPHGNSAFGWCATPRL